MGAAYDVAIVGLGPAGRSLAHHCAARGLDVLAVDPAPHATWTPTYGVWADEVDGLLPDSVARSRVHEPAIAAPHPRPLPRTYVLLDNRAVQASLSLDGVDLREERLDDEEVTLLRHDARVVVDARGAMPASGGRHAADLDGAPAQTAYGIVVESGAAEPALRGQAGMLMDWALDWMPDRPQRGHRGATSPGEVPTFLYALPLGDGTTLLEETALAAAPALKMPELRDRLHRRLRRRGVAESALAAPIAEERVVIPMRGRGVAPPRGVAAIGTAGRGGNLVTGYSVAHSLRSAPRLADRLAAGRPLPSAVASPAAETLREAGLRALLRLDIPGTLALFDAFGRVPGASQQAFLERGAPTRPLLTSMWRMYRHMAPRGRRALVRATLAPW